MKTTLLSPQQFVPSQWSGGSSTQLYISPANATFSERNFELRISTAKVEVEQSSFTPLPGIQRKLMILDGEITIKHEGQYSKNLQAFDVDHFSGDWKTSSMGTCTDFNVMTSKPQESEFYHLKMEATKSYKFRAKQEYKKTFLYLDSGNIQLQLRNEKFILETGSLFIIEHLNGSFIDLTSNEAFDVVVLEIN